MNPRKYDPSASFKLFAIVASLCISSTAHAQHFEYKEHHLGPTGLFGVTSPSDIKITKVEPGSPADGKIQVGDVIVGAGGTRFKENTRPVLADAIDQAETEQSKGILTLDLNDGRKVELQLKVLGSYSGTAPYNCSKTDAIITQAADCLVKSKDLGHDTLNISLLGLLATGERKYINVAREAIHQANWAKPDVKLSLGPESSAWSYGYNNLLLCEYYLLTHDDYVLPTIKTYAVTIAEGRDAAGLWGHRMADPQANRGQLHGRLFGYAVMNSSSLPLFISLMLAEKCGIKHPEVQAGIAQDYGFYSSFIGKGTLPYGVHDPKSDSFNNNGMSGMAAIAFSLHGDKEGTTFFSRMSTAASNTMELGHTGHYFNQLWTGLGADLAGPAASADFFRETRWLHTLNRNWDGNFTFDSCEGKGPEYSYRGLSDAGSHLLNYCLPRHKLIITGREADPLIRLNDKEAAETIALATMDIEHKSDEELLALMGHPMPKVRGEAAETLRGRQHKLLPSIVKMLKDGTKEQRMSAIGYFGNKCPPEQVQPMLNELAAMMRDPKENLSLRAGSAAALAGLGETGYPYYNDMLRIIVADEPDDAAGRLDEDVGRSLVTLCADPYAAGLVKDKKLFYAAALKLLDHKRASARIFGITLIAHVPLEDFYLVADKVAYIIDDKDLTYHSYHNMGPKTGAISILASLNIQGGIEAAFDALEVETGKAGFKIRMLMDVLPKYGANAQYALPKIKAVNAGKFQEKWDAMIKQIESATASRKMITLDEAKHYGQSKSPAASE